MHKTKFSALAAVAASLAVAAWAPIAQSQQVAAAKPTAAAPMASRAVTVDEYKKHVATHIAKQSAHVYAESLPPILKSVVVLDITIDAEGNVTRLSIFRSNGYEDAEAAAMDSVRRAGKLPAPSPEVLAGQTSVRILESWLVRQDNQFQVRSAVPPQPAASDVAARGAKKKPAKPAG